MFPRRTRAQGRRSLSITSLNAPPAKWLDIYTKWCYINTMDFFETFVDGIVNLITGFIEAMINIF